MREVRGLVLESEPGEIKGIYLLQVVWRLLLWLFLANGLQIAEPRTFNSSGTHDG